MQIDEVNNWKSYFDQSCEIAINQHTLSDKTEVLSIQTTPLANIENHHPVVLIPGWFSQIFAWENVIKIVSKHVPLLYIETREKNTSVLKKEKQTQMGIDRLTEDLKEILAELKFDITNSIGVGSSLGGSMWIQYLAYNNPKPWQTVLIGPNPNYDLPPIIGRLLLALPLFMIRLARKYVKWHILKFRLDPKKEPEQAEKYIKTFDEADSWKIRQSARHVTKFDGWNLLSKIEANVILVGASSDKLHAAERTIKVGKLIKNSQYIDFKSNKMVHDTEFGEFLVQLSKEQQIEGLVNVSDVKD